MLTKTLYSLLSNGWEIHLGMFSGCKTSYQVYKKLDILLSRSLSKGLARNNIKLKFLESKNLKHPARIKYVFDECPKMIYITLRANIGSGDVGLVNCTPSECKTLLVLHELFHVVVMCIRLENDVDDEKFKRIFNLKRPSEHDPLFCSLVLSIVGLKDEFNSLN